MLDNFPRFCAESGMSAMRSSPAQWGAPNHYQLAREKVQSEILSLPAEPSSAPATVPSHVAEQLSVNPFF
ncbi:MAG: hypothetical protein CM1200mP29_14450 [Verrucomicrobiota bacterium]|nr:MAG: hypothetical protein CM1200mP29_14450 [Verrucomicrobiota bacterium]